MDNILNLLHNIEKSKHISTDDNNKIYSIKGVYLSQDTKLDFKTHKMQTTVTIYTSGPKIILNIDNDTKWEQLPYDESEMAHILITYSDGSTKKLSLG